MSRHCVNPACGRRIWSKRCSVANRFKHGGRGLCQPCYSRAHGAGEHADFERITRTSAETVAEVEFLYSIGLTRLQAAQRLGVTSDAIYRAYRRTQTHARSRA